MVSAARRFRSAYSRHVESGDVDKLQICAVNFIYCGGYSPQEVEDVLAELVRRREIDPVVLAEWMARYRLPPRLRALKLVDLFCALGERDLERGDSDKIVLRTVSFAYWLGHDAETMGHVLEVLVRWGAVQADVLHRWGATGQQQIDELAELLGSEGGLSHHRRGDATESERGAVKGL